ncbi:hypothetical protein HDU76_001674 [Blyttiomyces sp. JEL0837]|nr:hypothetical protein HDU76_001674 [Blyttiomyces sp. JEL0837]
MLGFMHHGSHGETVTTTTTTTTTVHHVGQQQIHKKALLIGILYKGSKYQLNGCVNDITNMKNYITTHLGYSNDPHHMVTMTEDSHEPHHRPTRNNIIAAMHWLISGNQPGDHLFLHYSGHGGQVRDVAGDKEKGLMDTIVPMDFESSGQIDSDFLYTMLVHNLPPKVKLTVIMDCCHSGRILKLPFTYQPDPNGNLSSLLPEAKTILTEAKHLIQGGFSFSTKMQEAKSILSEVEGIVDRFVHRPEVDQLGFKVEKFLVVDEELKNPKEVYLLAGCKDDQESADVTMQGIGSTGALSYALLTTLERDPHQTYESLLANIREFMSGKFKQIPQMSCGIEVDPKMPVVL